MRKMIYYTLTVLDVNGQGERKPIMDPLTNMLYIFGYKKEAIIAKTKMKKYYPNLHKMRPKIEKIEFDYNW